MSSNFERLHEIINQAYAENFSILTQKMANPLLNPSLHFLIGIPFLITYPVTINLPIGIFAGLLDLDLAFFLLGLADEDPSPEPRVPPSMITLVESLQHNEEQLTQGLNQEIFLSTQSLCGERNLSLPD